MAKNEYETDFFERKNNMPEQEQVSLGEYAMNPRRYGNALIEQPEGLPLGVLDLDETSLRQMMNYIDKGVCNWTGKSTYLDKVVSFINSGAYSDSYLEKVFGHKYITKTRNVKRGSNVDKGSYEETDENEEIRYYIKNKNEYAKIEIDALQNWERKKLGVFFEEYLTFKYGKLTKELVEQTILSGIVESQDENMKLRWVKEAKDILGMSKGSNNLTQVNVYNDGGGKGLGKKITEVSGNDNFNILGDE